MSARAEISTNAQNPETELSASKGMSVALIGPNDAHRRIVASALSSADDRQVHEFADYPEKLSDLSRMLGQNFDVVLVDVDTDESYALQVIEKVAELGPAVMAYSARSDQELLMSCMRAGARDFLPLPTENQANSEPAPEQKPNPVLAAQAVPKAPEPIAPPVVPASTAVPDAVVPGSAPVQVAPRANVTPIVPERRTESSEQRTSWVTDEPARPAAHVSEVSPLDIMKDPAKPEPPLSEFAEWDAAHLRRAQAPPVKRPEPRPRPSLVPERKNRTEAPPRVVPSVVPSVVPPPSPAVERPPVAVDIFRSSHMEREVDENAERQGTNWIKWILIAAGPLVLALVLMIVFTRSSSQNTASSPAKQAPALAETSAPTDGQMIVDATGKTTPTPVANKPSPISETTEDEASTSHPKPVAPDAMAQQLVAPARIAGNIKSASSDEPPPAAPAPVALEDNSTIPGSVFGTASKARVTPHVVPISAGVADGMIIHRTQPVYPKFAQEAHITGKVVLKATITKQGSIEGVQVLSGPKILAPAAVDAVKTWKYRPYMLDGQPVAVETNITIIFGTSK